MLKAPLPANFLKDKTLFAPGVADRKNLAPMYARVYEKYIKNDEDAIMWFEPPPMPGTIPLG